MASKKEWEDRVANDLVPKYEEEIQWGSFVTALQAAMPQERRTVIDAFRSRNLDELGKVLVSLVRKELLVLAEEEAVDIVNKMDLKDLNRWKD